MKFIDEATIEVIAGDGGNGCVSFRREKHIPKGGPNGGDGGHGGHCILKASAQLSTLMDLQYRKRFQAESGEHGMGKDMFGRRGEDRVIRVPVGTIIFDAATSKQLYDMNVDGKEWIAARGGRGGFGNIHFTSSTRQAPRVAKQGEPGEARKIRLELKLLADVGLVGFPNAGKSTLISVISNARPKIADYPFTTTFPHLGVVRIEEEKSFVVADIPGLIEGAHEGAGMGVQFLRHIERTRVLLHLLDCSEGDAKQIAESYKILRAELKGYDPALLKKPELIVLTKMDIPNAREVEAKVKAAFKKGGKPVLAISAVKKEGLKELIYEVGRLCFK